MAFSSLPGEVDTRPFLDAARSTDKAILLPRIVDDNLEFALSTEGDRLVRGPYGVLEPGPEAAARSIAREAIILVPGIAFDVRGGRLGRGAGYYDRALAGLRRDFEPTAIIGLGFALQLVEQVPMTPQDVHVDGILTEDGLIWADPRRSDDADRDGESTK